MKTLTRNSIVGVLGAAAWLIANPGILKAQDGPPPGNFDPEQRRQRMMERLREDFGVNDDSEWKLISERISKVMEARRALGGGFGGGFMFRPGGPGGQGGAAPRPDNTDSNAPPPDGPPGAGGFNRGPGGPGPGFARASTPEMEALRKAVDSKGSAEELKARLADVKAARQKNQATLEQAQQQLSEVLSVRQEAVATTMGLLN